MNEPLNPKYQAICQLEAMLSETGIRHRIERCFDGWRIAYPDDETRCVCSVIEHRASMGSSQDRLEIKGLLNTIKEKAPEYVDKAKEAGTEAFNNLKEKVAGEDDFEIEIDIADEDVNEELNK